MTINPFILLGIGSIFAFLYATVIIIGSACTRRNRHKIQKASGISIVKTIVLDKRIPDAPSHVRTVSLINNTFTDEKGKQINMSSMDACIAIGESEKYPGVKNGDLILFDKSGNMKYCFTLPDIRSFR